MEGLKKKKKETTNGNVAKLQRYQFGNVGTLQLVTLQLCNVTIGCFFFFFLGFLLSFYFILFFFWLCLIWVSWTLCVHAIYYLYNS
jgi:hypothetical protein